MNTQTLLCDSRLLSALSPKKINAYMASRDFNIVSYAKGVVIHFEGDECSNFELILSGVIVVDRIDEFGNLFTISTFTKDDILGGNMLFSKNPYYPMTITAQEDAVILEIARETLFDIFCENPVFLRGFLAYISDHTFILGDKIKTTVYRPLREKLLHYLRREQNLQGSSRIQLNQSKKKLAEHLGVQRSSLSRELAKMRDEGLIAFDRYSITLHV